MRMYFTILLMLLVVSSCDTTKSIFKKKENIKESGVRIITQEKDSVVYVPKIIKKDTTIVVESKNIVLKNYYKQGNLSKVTCEQKENKIKEYYEKEGDVLIKEKNVERDGFKWSDKYILYLFIFIFGLKFVDKLFDKLL